MVGLVNEPRLSDSHVHNKYTTLYNNTKIERIDPWEVWYTLLDALSFSAQS